MHNNLPDETQLANGQKFELLSLALLGVPSMAEKFLEVSNTLKQLSFDNADYVCMKFILLLNSGTFNQPSLYIFDTLCFSAEVRNLNNRAHVQESSEQVHQILMEYCHNCYPNVPVRNHHTTISTEILTTTLQCSSIKILTISMAEYSLYHLG